MIAQAADAWAVKRREGMGHRARHRGDGGGNDRAAGVEIQRVEIRGRRRAIQRGRHAAQPADPAAVVGREGIRRRARHGRHGRSINRDAGLAIERIEIRGCRRATQADRFIAQPADAGAVVGGEHLGRRARHRGHGGGIHGQGGLAVQRVQRTGGCRGVSQGDRVGIASSRKGGEGGEIVLADRGGHHIRGVTIHAVGIGHAGAAIQRDRFIAQATEASGGVSGDHIRRRARDRCHGAGIDRAAGFEIQGIEIGGRHAGVAERDRLIAQAADLRAIKGHKGISHRARHRRDGSGIDRAAGLAIQGK